MLEKLNTIELSSGKYPIKCDLNVLEAVQEAYGSLSVFERELAGIRTTGEKDENGKKVYVAAEPSMKAIRQALFLMINEGIDIENMLKKKERPQISETEAGYLASNVDIYEVADRLHEEFKRCFESKNRKSTQEEKKAR